MSENQPPEETQASGSRWEDAEAAPPVDSETAADEAAATPIPEHATATAEPVAEPAATTAAPDRSRWVTGKVGLIGAGLGIALVAGIGGFAIGNATADGGDHGRFDSERRFERHSDDGRPMPPAPGDQDGQRGPGGDDLDQGDSSTQG